MLDLDSKKLAKIPGIYKYFNPHQCKINLALEYSTNETEIQTVFFVPLVVKFYLTMNLLKKPFITSRQLQVLELSQGKECVLSIFRQTYFT